MSRVCLFDNTEFDASSGSRVPMSLARVERLRRSRSFKANKSAFSSVAFVTGDGQVKPTQISIKAALARETAEEFIAARAAFYQVMSRPLQWFETGGRRLLLGPMEDDDETFEEVFSDRASSFDATFIVLYPHWQVVTPKVETFNFSPVTGTLAPVARSIKTINYSGHVSAYPQFRIVTENTDTLKIRINNSSIEYKNILNIGSSFGFEADMFTGSMNVPELVAAKGDLGRANLYVSRDSQVVLLNRGMNTIEISAASVPDGPTPNVNFATMTYREVLA